MGVVQRLEMVQEFDFLRPLVPTACPAALVGR